MFAIILVLKLLSAKVQQMKTSYIVDRQCMEDQWRCGRVVCCQVFDSDKKKLILNVQTTTIFMTGERVYSP